MIGNYVTQRQSLSQGEFGMTRLKIEDLARIKDETRRSANLREGAGRVRVTVHMGTCGIAAGARNIMSLLLSEIEKRNISDVIVNTSGCAGLCSREPMITVEIIGEAPVKYVDLTEKKMAEIINRHIMEGTPLADYALGIGSERTH